MSIRLRARGPVVVRVGLALLATLLLAACDLPRDPNGTLDRVRDGVMRVGISSNPPFAHIEDGRPRGLEIALVQAFAARLEADIVWVPGSLPGLLTALEANQLDVVLAGLTSGAPGLAGLATTAPYLTTRWIVAAPPSRPAIRDLNGREVAAPLGSPVAALLRERGAVPVADPRTAAMPSAVPDWQAGRRGLRPTGIELATEEHVMVVPPGENAWLVELERFLHDHRQEARRILWEGEF